MALLLPGTSTGTGTDCLPCASVRNILSQCGSCGQVGNQCSCQSPEYPAPCRPGDTLDPQCPNCCVPAGTVPSGGQPGGSALCPGGDVGAAVGGACPTGYMPDPAAVGCCKPQACAPGEHQQPCSTGEQVDAQTGCCQPMAVEACFVCPHGLPELASALQGQPNSCYLAGQFFLQPGALPPPAQA